MLDNEGEEGERVLKVVKSNLATIPPGIRFVISPVPDLGTACLEWK